MTLRSSAAIALFVMLTVMGPAGIFVGTQHKHNNSSSRQPAIAASHLKCPDNNMRIEASIFNGSAQNVCSDEDKMLFIGCGYSGTRYTTHLLMRYNVSIGHERSYVCGMSNWMATFEDNIVSAYKHTFMQVRHPMLVLNSALGTNWTSGKGWWMFKVNKSQALTGLPNKSHIYNVDVRTIVQKEYSHLQWDIMKYPFRILAWWVVYTEGALSRVQYWYRLEDLASNARCRQYIVQKILSITNVTRSYSPNKSFHSGRKKINSHSKDAKTPQELWKTLNTEAKSDSEKHVVHHVKQLAVKLGYDVTTYLHKESLLSNIKLPKQPSIDRTNVLKQKKLKQLEHRLSLNTPRP